MPLGYLQFLIQGGKNRLHIADRSHSCVPLPPPALPASATSVSLVHGLATLLTHQSLAHLTLGGGAGLSRLFDHPRPQPIHLLIHCLFNLGQRR
jgi:hypothetical protein